jgi:hypothetical protein
MLALATLLPSFPPKLPRQSFPGKADLTIVPAA